MGRSTRSDVRLDNFVEKSILNSKHVPPVNITGLTRGWHLAAGERGSSMAAEETVQSQGALEGLRVLEMGGDKVEYGTKILAELGADVVKIEPPNGDPSRKVPPFAGDIPHPERSLRFLYRNINKRGITLNLDSQEGQGLLKRLVERADILMECFPPGYLEQRGIGYSSLREVDGKLIFASVTDFGQSGPYRDYKGSDIVNFAMGGGMYASGRPEAPPCLVPGSLTADCAATYAGVAAMIALRHRNLGGEGQYIEVSVQEAGLGALYPWSVTTYSHAPINPATPALNPRGSMGMRGYPAKDGYVRLGGNVPRQWDALVEWLGSPEVLLLPEWRDARYRRQNQDVLNTLMTEFTEQHTKEYLFHEGQRRGIPATSVNTPAEFLEDPNTKARGYFVSVEHPIVGEALYPGSPYQMTETPVGIRRAAPLLGQHNQEVYHGELGLSPEELAALYHAGVI